MSISPPQLESPRWWWIPATWLGIGLFDATQTVFVMRAEGMHHYWGPLFFNLLVAWLPWALATPLVLWLQRRYPPAEWKRPATWAVHLVTCAGCGLAHAMWVSMWSSLLNPWAAVPGPAPFRAQLFDKFYGGLLSYVILYSLILLAGHMLESRERMARQQTETARLNEQLSKAQLYALRRQIEPHFLFNTLNAISGLVRENRSEDAVSMIAGLSDFLRRVVADSDRQQVPLREELEFTQKYLEIQKVRFADRLEFKVDIPEELLSAQVPSLILQPMVENAVKYGISKRMQGGTIQIAASQSNGTLTFRIYNDGPRLPVGGSSNGSGIGISNVRTRLQSLYGSAFELSLRNHGTHGVEAQVAVPFVPSAESTGTSREAD